MAPVDCLHRRNNLQVPVPRISVKAVTVASCQEWSIADRGLAIKVVHDNKNPDKGEGITWGTKKRSLKLEARLRL